MSAGTKSFCGAYLLLIVTTLLVVGVVFSSLEKAAAATPVAAGTTFTVDYGNPNSTGTATTTITVSYTDSLGVKKEKTVSASLNITDPNMSATGKAHAMEDALRQAADDAAVGGASLLDIGGAGEAVSIAPAANSSGNFSDVKVCSVKTTDKSTGEKDQVNKPAGSPLPNDPQSHYSLASISFENGISGQTVPSQGSTSPGSRTLHPPVMFSELRVQTVVNDVTDDFTITLGSPLGALEPEVVVSILQQEFVLRGIPCWREINPPTLHVLMEEEFTGIAVGSTDSVLIASCEVRVE